MTWCKCENIPKADGWEILDELKASGFIEAKALLYHSVPLGYLGGESETIACRWGLRFKKSP